MPLPAKLGGRTQNEFQNRLLNGKACKMQGSMANNDENQNKSDSNCDFVQYFSGVSICESLDRSRFSHRDHFSTNRLLGKVESRLSVHGNKGMTDSFVT